MGRGSYSSADWNRLKNSKGISSSSTADDIFSQNKVNEKYIPAFINIRESRDSEDSPESTPIIIGFDSTGSMGYLAAEIAKNSLNKTATMILEKRPVTDPHIMCAAFTNPQSKIYPPVQVTQFEADIRVVEQMLEFTLGGGNMYSYDSLIWYFALRHTITDCFEKRKKKGFLFCIGDEICDDGVNDILLSNDIKNVFADELNNGYSTYDLYKEVSERYNIIHIITGDRINMSLKTWEKVVPGINSVIPSDKIQYLAEVMISIMQIIGGLSKEYAVSQWSGETFEVVKSAIETIDFTKY